MSDPKYLFQYCQKLVILNEAMDATLLAKRQGEQDYDGVFTFVGGKMETTDADFLEGAKREKNEEIGEPAQLEVYMGETKNLLFRKKDGNAMIIPHFACLYTGGDIVLSDEYSEYQWVPIIDLAKFEPKIDNIPAIVDWAVVTLSRVEKGELVRI